MIDEITFLWGFSCLHIESMACTYSGEHKYLNTLRVWKFSLLELKKGSETLIVGAFKQWETTIKKIQEITFYDF